VYHTKKKTMGQETNELNNSSSSLSLKDKMKKNQTNEEENPVYEFEKNLLERDDPLENPFKIVGENPKFGFKFQLNGDLKKSSILVNRDHKEEKVLSSFENEKANEDKENELLLVEIEKAEEERDAKNDEKNNQILECAQETHGN